MTIYTPDRPAKVMVVYGTRPEAIKLAPLIKAIEADLELVCLPVTTGQHREMLDSVNALFDIKPVDDLNLLRHEQTLVQLTARAMSGLEESIAANKPDVIVVQGDTSTSFAGALTAFLRGIPVVHVEAGLRTGDLASPFPEEGNRKLTAAVASLHLAPTPRAASALLAENVDAESVLVTGNTVIDALQFVAQANGEAPHPSVSEREYVLVTVHRRESWGPPLVRIGEALRTLAGRYPDIDFIAPLHANPLVRDTLLPLLADSANVHLLEAQEYRPFIQLLSGCLFVLTDSGGIQEEAPGFGKPVLIMRDTTERPEGIECGTSRLVGTDGAMIVKHATALLTDRTAYDTMANANNPFGDGRAAERSVMAIKHLLGLGPTPQPFTPK